VSDWAPPPCASGALERHFGRACSKFRAANPKRLAVAAYDVRRAAARTHLNELESIICDNFALAASVAF